MYRQAAHIGLKARYGGLGSRPPQTDAHDLISRHTGSEEQRLKAHDAHINTLIAAQIMREEDAVKHYQYLLEEMDKSPRGYTQGKEIVAHIREQEIGHAALLRRLR